MAAQTQEQPLRAGDSSARLKQAIDSGRTGDKIVGFDPGAAPLGTDEESAESSLGPAAQPPARDFPASAELAADPRGNERAGYRGQDRVAWPAVVAAILLVIVAVIAFIWLGR